METFILPGGLYAVFLYHGSSDAAAGVFQYILVYGYLNLVIFWTTDHILKYLGEKYKNDDPDSEEEIWIPVKPGM